MRKSYNDMLTPSLPGEGQNNTYVCLNNIITMVKRV